jgi:hypothetical protein
MSSEPDVGRPRVRFRKGVPAPERRRCRRRRGSEKLSDSMSDPIVIDDLPEIVLVGPRELDAIETYLGHLLNELSGAGTAKARACGTDQGGQVEAHQEDQ